jgi:hypothetical protein
MKEEEKTSLTSQKQVRCECEPQRNDLFKWSMTVSRLVRVKSEWSWLNLLTLRPRLSFWRHPRHLSCSDPQVGVDYGSLHKKLEYTIVYSKYFGVHCSVLQKTDEIWSVQPCTPFFLECGLVHSIHIWSAPSMHSDYFWCTPNLMCGVQVFSLQKKLECTLMHSKNLEYICIPWSASKSKDSNDFSVPLR